jgi:hypothetical protein
MRFEAAEGKGGRDAVTDDFNVPELSRIEASSIPGGPP